MTKALYFGLPVQLDLSDPREPVLHAGFIVSLLLGVLHWIEGWFMDEYDPVFCFRTYTGSYWVALYRYLFKPATWSE